MDNSFYRKNNSSFFEGKEAIMLRTIKNGRGDVIRKGAKVILTKRYGGFEVKSKYQRKWITRVKPEDIDLFKKTKHGRRNKKEKK